VIRQPAAGLYKALSLEAGAAQAGTLRSCLTVGVTAATK